MKTINELVPFFESLGCTKYEAYDLALKEQQTKLLEQIKADIQGIALELSSIGNLIDSKS